MDAIYGIDSAPGNKEWSVNLLALVLGKQKRGLLT